MPDELAPLHKLTAEDRGSIIIISAYSWVFVTTIIAIIRFGFAINQKLKFKLDDLIFAIAALLAIANSVCYHVSVNSGLGRHISDLSPDDLALYYKVMFTGQYLGVAAMASAKAAVLLLSDRIAPQEPRNYYTVLLIIGIWALFSVLSVSFQCQLPDPWVYIPSKCSTHGNLQYPIIIGNQLTDALLATWILPTIWKLLMDKDKRIAVMVLFGTRIIVPFAAIGQMISVSQNLHVVDQTWASFAPSIWTQVVIHLSVICATLPRTNRFFASLQAGLISIRLTDFELNTSRKPSQTPDSEEPPLRLTPSSDTKTTTNAGSRQKKQRSGIDWRMYTSMGGSRDDENSASSLYSQGGAGPRREGAKRVEYVKKEPVMVRRG
ncbi:hypothetical protein K432DRAFT_355802 [Lepidopterella palustris CBS 459.81]|uniref:Rhodopsin domain-containing protein n=1 Tax=Lepidopterella palustris CBS 459.81 TaxID=1314670 RepID=A0A8E2JDT8_9PEZI|nr:hypothetical protein K432DRAFT_355802 [Lepidopterella palustris CBS 459.81]